MFRALNVLVLGVLVGLCCAIPGVTIPSLPVSVPNVPVSVPNVPVSLPNVPVSVPPSSDLFGLSGLIKVIVALVQGLLSILTDKPLESLPGIIPSELVGIVPTVSQLLSAILASLPSAVPTVPGLASSTPITVILEGAVAGLVGLLIQVLQLVVALLLAVLAILSGNPLQAVTNIIPSVLAGANLNNLPLSSLLNPILATITGGAGGGILGNLLGGLL